MSRSMISDLNSLVNEATTATGGGGGGSVRHLPPPPPRSTSTSSSTVAAARSGGSTVHIGSVGGGGRSTVGGGASVADDASIFSFTRSVARVARAAESKDGASHAGVGRYGSGLPPPPVAPRPGPGSVASGISGSSTVSGRGSHRRSRSSGRSTGGASSRSSSSSRSNRSRQSNATDRLMSLVQELSQPRHPGAAREDPSAGGGSGYLPSQYIQGGGSNRSRSSNSSRSRGGGSRSRGSNSDFQGSHNFSHSRGSSNDGRTVSSGSVAADSKESAGSAASSSVEPTGFVMPPGRTGSAVNGSQQSVGQYSSDPEGNSMYGESPSAAPSANNQSSYGGNGNGNDESSLMSGNTSVGQSTIPTKFENSASYLGNFNNFSVSPVHTKGSAGTDASYEDSFAGQPQPRMPSSSASAPGGSFGSSNNSNNNMEAPSVASRSYLSTPLVRAGGGPPVMIQNGSMNGDSRAGVDPSFEDSFDGQPRGFVFHGSAPSNGSPPRGGASQYSQQGGGASQYSASQPPGSQYSQSNPSVYSASHYSGGQPPPYHMVQKTDVSYMDSGTFASSSSRSLANSNAIIPRARFSWASESIGAQSTVLTRRSVASASVPEPHHEREGSKVVEGRLWASFAWIITFPIPNKCVMRPTKDAKQAWREKVALFLIMVSCSVFFVGVFGFVPLLLCKEDTIFSIQDVWLQTGENWVVVHGIIYDVKDLIYRHPGGVKGIVDYLGKDASKVFPRAPPVTLPQKCLDMEKVQAYNLDVYTPDNNFTNPSCASFSDLDVLLGITCHTFAAGSNGTAKFLGDYERGMLSHTTVGLGADGIQWFALYERVYDVTNYIRAINENREPVKDEGENNLDNNPAAYLTPTLNKVIMNSLGGDATDLYEALFGSTEYIACLEEMFYAGLLDDEFDTFCYTLNIMMYCMLIFVATLMVIQFIASMVYICPRHRTYSEEDVMSPVMIMVPCYNEGDNELRKTIKSVLNTTYPDENKVLFMVADGLVTGNGEDMSTPEHLANILGFDIDEFEDDTFEYDCIGVTHTKNRARVYHGILQKGHKFLKYITVAKVGLPEEANSSSKPGNRGKRDSQLVIMGYYNRIHYGRELTELDSAIQRAMVDLNLQADMVRFLMAIDADTRVDTMSITHMVYGMDKKEKVLALCGETKVDNKASSWVTMIQVFEYYNSHHLKKAFEAAFGCVTCLPGCFTMYRIIADDGTPLLPGDGVLYEYSRNDIETLHEKNLYHLGEDRMLTTLLLKYYPDRSLTFIPEAACWTIVPHTFRILLSQRRRWINSTVHNMFELLKVNTMCGVCCVSMKVVVAIDLIATMILPASYCYAMYLLFLVFFESLPVSTVLLILYAIIMGVQVVVFILRSRWEYLWWFAIYFVVGLPVFYLVLPTYAFWNMDDFSWGKTRAVGGSAANNAEEEDDESENEDSDGDDGYKKLSNKGRGTDDDSVPSSARDDHSTTSSSSNSSSSDEDDSRDDSDYESGSEYSKSLAKSDHFSRGSKMP